MLKLRDNEPERVLAAFDTVNGARKRGWPTPEWLAVGILDSGEAWILQELIRGTTPPTLDGSTATRMIAILDIQSGLGSLARLDMSEWAHGVVFGDWRDNRRTVDDGFPGGRLLVERVDRIASACTDEPLSTTDLVHANFSTANSVFDGRRLWVVDVDGVGRGTIAYDAAEALMIAAGFEVTEPAGLAVFWQFVNERLDHREFLVSMGSVALTMANAFIRLDHVAEAPAALPGMLQIIDHALELLT